jgi:hypothetical protein
MVWWRYFSIIFKPMDAKACCDISQLGDEDAFTLRRATAVVTRRGVEKFTFRRKGPKFYGLKMSKDWRR